jgi:hypothetical protein
VKQQKQNLPTPERVQVETDNKILNKAMTLGKNQSKTAKKQPMGQ